jgi:hypothetical protein
MMGIEDRDKPLPNSDLTAEAAAARLRELSDERAF